MCIFDDENEKMHRFSSIYQNPSILDKTNDEKAMTNTALYNMGGRV